MTEYDTIIIGGGSAGVRLARLLSKSNSVLLIEKGSMGGTCVNVGCVPKKLMVNAAKFSLDIKKAIGNGWLVGETSFKWETLRDSISKEILRLNGIYTSMLEKSGVTIVNGFGTLVDDNTVYVNGEIYTSSDKIVVATGGTPNKLNIPGGEHAITSDDFFSIDSIPESVVIIGNGYIGVEFAGILNCFGSEVTLVGNHKLPIKGFDIDLREKLRESIVSSGIKTLTNKIAAIDKTSDGFNVIFEDESIIRTKLVIAAVGRKPNVDGLGLKNTSLETKKGFPVEQENYWYENYTKVVALGDVVNSQNLTPVATASATEYFNSGYKGEWTSPDYDNVPKAVFYTYPVSSCGMTEEEAAKNKIDYKVYKSEFTPMSQAFSSTKTKTFMKMIVRIDNDEEIVIGVHMFGEDAPEIIQGMAIAVVNGLTKEQVDRTIGIHPTSAEEFVTMR